MCVCITKLKIYITKYIYIIKNRISVVADYQKNWAIQTLGPFFTQEKKGVIPLGGLPAPGGSCGTVSIWRTGGSSTPIIFKL